MASGNVDYWAFFADDARRTGSALYARLAQGVCGDDQLRALAAHAKTGQPHANVLFAAVHFLLMRGAQHPLHDFYPDFNGGHMADGDPFPPFRDFCLSYREQLLPLITTRVTNTNEVGRSALLHAGFRVLAREAGAAPLHLIEIGPSAGLNLIWDRYGVRYTRDGAIASEIAAGAPLVIDCALRGAGNPPSGPAPAIAHRLGLELNPVALTDDDDRDWLRALVWPDQGARLSRLDRAIALFMDVKPEIRFGDALALLPAALAAAPADQTLCLYHTIALYQFSREMRTRLDAMLMEASRSRPLWRLSFEGALEGRYPLSLIAYRGGEKNARGLALAHPHGTWLEWWGEE
ncbi:MAG: DUF2332 domain-containing protein [Alphaproteobacteria bacterium]|nr:DUF2332 domain-containing protein [Alphaproteobacteria bacterium]MBN9577439.1 DUF2332 domain-containing protein [Alphaproteobacteria bacterium]